MVRNKELQIYISHRGIYVMGKNKRNMSLNYKPYFTCSLKKDDEYNYLKLNSMV
jgi:hypothetical protein